MNAVYQTALSFTSQNIGAKKYDRIDRVLLECLGLVSFIGLVLGVGAYVFGTFLLGIYTPEAEVIKYGLYRLQIVCVTYFTCGIMDVFSGCIRGLGYSVMPMLVSLTGACLLRVVWVLTIFQAFHTQLVLYISYPVSWVVTSCVHFICYIFICKRNLRAEELNEKAVKTLIESSN